MRDFLKHNGIWILVIALLLALITAVISITFGGVADPASNFFGVIATPFRNGLHAFVTWTEGVYNENFQRQAMTEELERLRQENAELKSQARQAEAALRENERLRDLAGLAQKRSDLTLESATVTARGSSNWSSTLTLSKGTAAGVAVGNCVIDQYGDLVGVVTEVGLNWCTIITVVDADLQIGALIARTDGAAIAEGDFTLMGQGRLMLTYLPEGTRLLAGDEILTSGLMSGGSATYPSGLLIGTVEQLRTDASGMSDYAVLKPAADLSALEQVFIIKAFDIVE